MDIFRQLGRKIRSLIRRIRPEQIDPGGQIVEARGGIHDGVNYGLPFLLPGYVQREAVQNKQVQAALTESLERYRSQFGDPYVQGDAPFLPPTDDPLKEWNWSTRERVLTSTHAAYQRNPLANSIVEFTTDFVVGDGFNLVCRNKDVENVLMDFINDPDNAVREYERQAVTDLQVDGELFIRFFEEHGTVVMAPQRPWEVHWIETLPGYFRRAVQYHMQRYLQRGDSPLGTETELEDVPADEMLHVAINRHSYELRGRPDLFRLLPWLGADKEWLEDRSRQNKWRNALLFHVQVAKATTAVLNAVQGLWRKPPPPGSSYVSSDAVTVNPITNSASAGDASHDGRSLRLMVILGARLPEYFFADGQNANLASAKKQELPALTKFETFQQIMLQQVWKPVFKRVLERAIAAGILAETCVVQDADGDAVADEEPIPTCEAFELSYEPVTSDDLKTLADAYGVMKTNGWVDDQTAQEALGLDVQIVRKRLDAERQRDAEAMARGEIPTPPGMVPPGYEGAQQDDDQDEAPEDEPMKQEVA